MKKTSLLKYAALILVLALSCAAPAATPAMADTLPAQLPGRGLFINTLNNRDFPFAPGVTGTELSSQIDSIVYSARTGGYDAIFFEARPAGDSFYQSKVFPRSAFYLGKQNKLTLKDPLRDLIKAAGKEGIPVYAVLNPYFLGSNSAEFSRKSPAVKYSEDCFTAGRLTYLKPESDRAMQLNRDDVNRLFDKYDLAGIILHGIDNPELAARDGYTIHLAALVTALGDIAAEHGKIVGVVTAESPFQSAIDAESTDAHIIIPRLLSPPGPELSEQLSQWCNLAGKDRIMPILSPFSLPVPTTSEAIAADKNTLVDQLFLAQNAGISRYAVDSLRTAVTEPSVPRLSGALINPQKLLSGIDLTYEKSLYITRPAERIGAASGSYYIFGLSDPDLPLFMDGKEVERNTQNGLFGVLVKLQMGENTFVFTQGSTRKTAVINRYSASDIRRTTTLSALQPAHFAFARQDEPVTLTCTGPAGGTVSVAVNGTTLPMRPRTSAAAGTPVVYEATLRLPNSFYTPGETHSAGPATYLLTYDGRTTEHTSDGAVYGIAAGADAAIRVTSQNTSVYIDPAQDGVFSGQLKPGTSDFVIGETTNYCELSSGGYVRKECCEVVTGTPDVLRTVASISPVRHGRDDLLFLSGGAGAPFLIEQDENGLTLTLYNIAGFPAETPTFSDLFADCILTQNGHAVSLRLPYAGEKRPWGADVYYEEDDAVIAIRQKPALSGNKTQPLEGLIVMLDPGHGGSDPGALGVAGQLGPNESDLNLAVSLVTKGRLEALGATVYLTNSGSEDVTLVDRMADAQAIRPDFFISIHHNSVAETTDAGQAGGTECYYHFDNGRELAELLVQNVGEASGRYRRGAYESYYVVTKMSGFPSVLLELGFVSSPREYEKMVDTYDIFKTAGAIADAIYTLSTD